ncbi:MAG: hypothetical protein R6V53_00740 [Candidatus Woesearchaeota archaeon]
MKTIRGFARKWGLFVELQENNTYWSDKIMVVQNDPVLDKFLERMEYTPEPGCYQGWFRPRTKGYNGLELDAGKSVLADFLNFEKPNLDYLLQPDPELQDRLGYNSEEDTLILSSPQGHGVPVSKDHHEYITNMGVDTIIAGMGLQYFKEGEAVAMLMPRMPWYVKGEFPANIDSVLESWC